MNPANPADAAHVIKHMELLTESAQAVSADSRLLQDAVRKMIIGLIVAIALLIVLIALDLVTSWVQNKEAVKDRDRIQRVSTAILKVSTDLDDCLSPKKTDSDCQKRSRENLGSAYDEIEQRNRDQLIVALQCFRDPINVDNAAIEDCILSESELLRKQREMQ